MLSSRSHDDVTSTATRATRNARLANGRLQLGGAESRAPGRRRGGARRRARRRAGGAGSARPPRAEAGARRRRRLRRSRRRRRRGSLRDARSRGARAARRAAARARTSRSSARRARAAGPASSASMFAAGTWPSASTAARMLERPVPVAVERVDALVAWAGSVTISAALRPRLACDLRIEPAARTASSKVESGARRRRRSASASRNTAVSSRGESSSSLTISCPRLAVDGQWTRRSDSPCSYSRTLWRSKPVGRRMSRRRPSGVRAPASEKSRSSSTSRG